MGGGRSRGNRRRLGGASMGAFPALIRHRGEGKGGGKRGVMRGKGAAPFPGEEGAPGGARASSRRRRWRRPEEEDDREWAKLGPKQKRARRLDGPPWRGGPRWATAMAGRKKK
jgi:hypothetical protein